ncbi:MAG: DNA-directed RNA polymerase subunit omega [Planctomycetia bacterium]|nr:DNA-directed RNA polymerase subunit omega [Planctomycetia bacterium]
MLKELCEEQIVNKVGGRFKLATLIQKRLVQLNAGSRPLVNINTDHKMEIVIQEIIKDKIFLDTTLNVRVAGEVDGGGPPVLDLENLG